MLVVTQIKRLWEGLRRCDFQGQPDKRTPGPVHNRIAVLPNGAIYIPRASITTFQMLCNPSSYHAPKRCRVQTDFGHVHGALASGG